MPIKKEQADATKTKAGTTKNSSTNLNKRADVNERLSDAYSKSAAKSFKKYDDKNDLDAGYKGTYANVAAKQHSKTAAAQRDSASKESKREAPVKKLFRGK